MELTVLEKWTMYAQDPSDKWFLDYVVRSPRQAGIHLTAGWHAYKAVADVGIEADTAFEFFGGMGAQSLMIQELFHPTHHSVVDFSLEAVTHITKNIPAVAAWQGDSYSAGWLHRSDLVGLDFGDLTVWKTREGEQHRNLLDRVFAGAPKAAVLTDIAAPHLHLHRERYETLLGPGSCASYPLYLEALADRLEILYGYRVLAGFYDRWSTVMALVPGFSETNAPRFVPTPASPVGLTVIR